MDTLGTQNENAQIAWTNTIPTLGSGGIGDAWANRTDYPYPTDPVPVPQYPQATTGIGGDNGLYHDGGSYSRCSRDAHYFSCKHEDTCECGMTRRARELEVSTGL